MDVANHTAEDVNRSDQTICYQREKLKNSEGRRIRPPLIRFGEEVASVRCLLPQVGPISSVLSRRLEAFWEARSRKPP